MNPSKPFGRWVWGGLLFIAFAVRWHYVLRGHLAFHSDEAATFEYLRHITDLSDFSQRLQNYHGSMRSWLAAGVSSLMGGWFYAIPLTAMMLGLLGHALWVAFLVMRVSGITGLVTAVVLAFAPLGISYYGTLLEGRLETIILGAILALGMGSWLKNSGRAFGFGLISCWGLWADPFIIFFAFPIFAHEILVHLREEKKISYPLAMSGFTGALVGILPGVLQWSDPYQRTILQTGSLSYYRWGMVPLTHLWKQTVFLAGKFPLFLQGNMPYGYFQDTPLGRWLNPPASDPVLFLTTVWTWIFLLSAVLGFVLYFRSGKNARVLLAGLVVPTSLFIAFFMFSQMASTFWEFRYLSFVLVFIAAGWGLLVDQLWMRRRQVAIGLLTAWIVIQGTLYTLEWKRTQGMHPADWVGAQFEQLGLKAGFANYLASECIRVRSRGRLAIAPYDAPAFHLPSLKSAFQSDRIGVIIIKGLDPVGAPESFIQNHLLKYKPVGRYDFDHGFSIIEFKRREEPKTPR